MTENYYQPSGWSFIEIYTPGYQIIKLFASWDGGYLDSDEWRLNSGCTKIEETDDGFLVHGYSGSVYQILKNGEGRLNGYARTVLGDMLREMENYGARIITAEEAMRLVNTD